MDPPHHPHLPSEAFADGLQHLRDRRGKTSFLDQHTRDFKLNRQPLLHSPPLGNVRFDRHEVGQAALIIVDRLHFDCQPIAAAVPAVVENFSAEAFALAEPLTHVPHGFGIGARSLQQRPRFLAQDFLQRVAREPGEALVDPFRPALGIRKHDRVVGPRRDESELACVGFLLPQPFVGGAQFLALPDQLGCEFLRVSEGHFAGLQDLKHVHSRVMNGEILEPETAGGNFRRIGEPRRAEKEQCVLLGKENEFAAQLELRRPMFQEEKAEAVLPHPLQRHPPLGPDRTEDLIQVRAGLNIRANAPQRRTGLNQFQLSVQREMERKSRRKLLRRQADGRRSRLAGLVHTAGAGVQVTSKTSWTAPWSLVSV